MISDLILIKDAFLYGQESNPFEFYKSGCTTCGELKLAKIKKISTACDGTTG